MMSSKFLRFFLAAVLLFSPLCISAQDKPDALKEYRNKNYENAVHICMDEIKVNPANMDSYVVLGWSLIKLGRYSEAAQWSEKAMEYSRTDMRVVENLGESCYFLGDNAMAMKYFQMYAASVPSGGAIDSVYYYMGEIYISLGEYNNADIAITSALYHSPNSARWWSRLGYAREMAGSYKYALEAYEKSLQINPSYSEASRGKSRVQARLGS